MTCSRSHKRDPAGTRSPDLKPPACRSLWSTNNLLLHPLPCPGFRPEGQPISSGSLSHKQRIIHRCGQMFPQDPEAPQAQISPWLFGSLNRGGQGRGGRAGISTLEFQSLCSIQGTPHCPRSRTCPSPVMGGGEWRGPDQAGSFTGEEPPHPLPETRVELFSISQNRLHLHSSRQN